jgi:hypothetical protein
MPYRARVVTSGIKRIEIIETGGRTIHDGYRENMNRFRLRELILHYFS